MSLTFIGLILVWLVYCYCYCSFIIITHLLSLLQVLFFILLDCYWSSVTVSVIDVLLLCLDGWLALCFISVLQQSIDFLSSPSQLLKILVLYTISCAIHPSRTDRWPFMMSLFHGLSHLFCSFGTEKKGEEVFIPLPGISIFC